MPKKFKNRRKDAFLSSIPVVSIESVDNDITKRCKFNFSYFTIDEAGQNFSDWSQDELAKLLDKLKEYSKFSLDELSKMKVGRYAIFERYTSFPVNSDFKLPKHIPHQAIWCRFHLENRPRLIGFTIPEEFHDKIHQRTGLRFDTNTFYVVFLDRDHRFYKTKK